MQIPLRPVSCEKDMQGEGECLSGMARMVLSAMAGYPKGGWREVKSHIRPKVTNRQRAAVKELVAGEMAGQREVVTRRLMKLVCLCLSREFGFGPVRLGRLVESINRLLAEEGGEPEFWYRVDKALEKMGLGFEAEGED